MTASIRGGASDSAILHEGSEVIVFTTAGIIKGALGANLLHVRDEKTSGTAGGTFTSDAWRIRTLNTVVTNQITGASLSTNQITLPAGTYLIEASAPALASSGHKVGLYNVTDASFTAYGNNAHSNSSTPTATRSVLWGVFTIADTKVFELQHYGGVTKGTDGMGVAVSVPSVNEVYAEVLLWKLM